MNQYIFKSTMGPIKPNYSSVYNHKKYLNSGKSIKNVPWFNSENKTAIYSNNLVNSHPINNQIIGPNTGFIKVPRKYIVNDQVIKQNTNFAPAIQSHLYPYGSTTKSTKIFHNNLVNSHPIDHQSTGQNSYFVPTVQKYTDHATYPSKKSYVPWFNSENKTAIYSNNLVNSHPIDHQSTGQNSYFVPTVQKYTDHATYPSKKSYVPWFNSENKTAIYSNNLVNSHPIDHQSTGQNSYFVPTVQKYTDHATYPSKKSYVPFISKLNQAFSVHSVNLGGASSVHPLNSQYINVKPTPTEKVKLDDTASLISNDDIPDINSIKEFESYQNNKDEELVSFYKNNSIDPEKVEKSYEYYKKNLKGKINLKYYLAIRDYCGEDYKKMHAYTQSQLSNKSTKYQTYDHVLQLKQDNLYNALCSLGQTKGFTIDESLRLYKVAKLSQREIDQLKPGKIYEPHKFFSVSRGKKSILDSEYFTKLDPKKDIDKKRVFFVIENSGKYAVDLQHFSDFKGEKEALFLSTAKFEINQVKQNGDFLQVYMKCISD